MPEEKFTLKNSGGFEFNDAAHDRAFDLGDNNYKILLTPKTQFWRFGVRFGKTQDIFFYHPSGRYNNPDFPNIELNVGFKEPAGDWRGENRIELGTYHITGLTDSILDRWEQYESRMPVELDFRLDAASDILTVSYQVSGKHSFEKMLTLPGIKYFKVFAWADYIEYELDVAIQWASLRVREASVKSTATANVSSATSSSPDYWILKLRRFEIDVNQFTIGFRGAAHWAHDEFLDEIQDVGLLKRMKTGDKIIGFLEGTADNVAVAVLETKDFRKDDASGYNILEYSVLTKLEPYIRLEAFPKEINREILTNDIQVIISITGAQFEQILNAGKAGNGRSYFLPYFITEGNHTKTEDQLEFSNDIESIASVMALRAVNPPLAIGLFGKWGSGKSFFMDKLAVKIREYADRKAPEYIEQVVQVKFNSWHYSDSNLWASLISEIFNSLNDYAHKDNPEDMRTLTDLMEWTSLQKQAAEQRKKELQADLDRLKAEQRAEREKLEDISGIQLLKLFLSDEKIKKDLSELNNNDIERIVKDKERIDEYIGELKSAKNNLSYIFREILNFQGRRWLWLLTGALLIFITAILAKTVLKVQWSGLTTSMAIFYSTLVTFISKGVISLRSWFETLQTARDRLQSLKKTIESREADVPTALSEKEKELTAVSGSLELIDKKLSETTAKIEDIRSGKKLMSFIEEKTKDENYARQLGMISWIRRDFAMLDKLLREQHESTSPDSKKQTDIKLKIDRIVLYIDDLDRCSEDIVVKVLEAIHLLLAFPLFIVIVGVDPRWLNNALNKKMDTLFGNSGKETKEQTPTELLTNSYDYLEKIFQIPFAIKPISKPSGQALIKYLMRNEMENTADKVDNPPIDKPEILKPTVARVTGPGSMDMVAGDSPAQVDVEIGTDGQTRLTVIDEQKTIREDRIVLHFKKEELEFIQQISPLFAKSPRTINSYINIYRIIRSHRSLEVTDQSKPDEYLPVMLMLAVIVGYNEQAPEFIRKLSGERPDEILRTWLEKVNGGLAPTGLKLRKLNEEILALVDAVVLDKPLYEFRKNLALISRFSFRSI